MTLPATTTDARPQRIHLTMRQDNWWLQPLVTFLGLSILAGYATWAALQGKYYSYGNYLSPVYSPEIFGDSPHAWFGGKPGWWPSAIPFSPSLLILWAPIGFRMTCYYYRGAYYKAFWADPPSCSVAEPRKSYLGENSFPLIVQNLHRYFLYFALLFFVFLGHDAYKAMWFANPTTGVEEFGIGVGTLVITLNVLLLASYTAGCHSFRHLIGGNKDTLSAHGTMLKCYTCVSAFNRKHQNFAWMSFFGVTFADLYVRMCAMGIWTDFRIV